MTPPMWSLNLSIEDLKHFMNTCRQHAFLMIDEKGIIVSCSPGVSHGLDYENGQLVGLTLETILKDRETYLQLRQVLFHEGIMKQSCGDIELRKRQGGLLHSKVEVQYLIPEVGNETYAIISFSSLYWNLELSLLQQFAGAFMKDINLGVMLIDMTFSLVDISDTACRVLGFPREEILGKPVEAIFGSLPTEHQLVHRSLLDGLVVRNYAVSWMNNNERFDLLLDSNLLKDSDGRTMGAYIMFKDVTNLRSLEEQVKRSDRLAMIGQIAAGTAHEIRNPLTSIKGFMQVLRHTFEDKGMSKEQSYTEIMLTEINRINELVSEFLLLGKRKDVNYHEVDIHTALKEILPIIHNEAILHNVNVFYDPAGQLPKVIADRELLKQVYLNISKNGIEAMSEGGNLTIAVRADYEERYVLVEIRDTGPGIPNFLIDKIFDPFFTTKADGTGLGLSVCQRIVHDMGGAIRVSSKGFGTIFTVCLPFT